MSNFIGRLKGAAVVLVSGECQFDKVESRQVARDWVVLSTSFRPMAAQSWD